MTEQMEEILLAMLDLIERLAQDWDVYADNVQTVREMVRPLARFEDWENWRIAAAVESAASLYAGGSWYWYERQSWRAVGSTAAYWLVRNFYEGSQL